MKMNSDEEDDIVSPEKLPIYQKGKEIFNLIKRIIDLIGKAGGIDHIWPVMYSII